MTNPLLPNEQAFMNKLFLEATKKNIIADYSSENEMFRTLEEYAKIEIYKKILMDLHQRIVGSGCVNISEVVDKECDDLLSKIYGNYNPQDFKLNVKETATKCAWDFISDLSLDYFQYN